MWTKEPPSKPGFYWHRISEVAPYNAPEIVEVVEGQAFPGSGRELRVRVLGSDEELAVTHVLSGGEWSGPLIPPQ